MAEAQNESAGELIVPVAEIARRAGLDEYEHAPDITDAIVDAQDDVIAYIKRPLTPEHFTFTAVYPGGNYALDDPRAWPAVAATVDDTFTVTSYQANPDGRTFTVEVAVGIDATKERPIVRFITAHALESLRNHPRYADRVGRRIASVSAEGQSLSFVAGPSGEGAVGTPPNIKSLNPYRRMLVFRRHTPPAVLWPY